MCATGGRACGGFVLLVWAKYVANGGAWPCRKAGLVPAVMPADDTRTKFPTSGSVYLVWRKQKLRVPAWSGHVPLAMGCLEALASATAGFVLPVLLGIALHGPGMLSAPAVVPRKKSRPCIPSGRGFRWLVALLR